MSDKEEARKILVDNYETAPQLLEYKLYQVLKVLESPEQVAVFNDIMCDIETMVGDAKEDMVKRIARNIIHTAKADMLKGQKDG